MSNQVRTKMKTFEVGFNEYYHELASWTFENVNARNKQDALRRFARRHGIRGIGTDATMWKWWEGDWYFTFRYIRPVEIKNCPRCQGTGHIAVEL